MADAQNWGPSNPHPLSKLTTELVWEGKYDEYGNRREVDIAGCDMPLQKVEAIDEPFSRAQGRGQLDMFKKQSRRQDDFRNMLIWGDNKLVMASLLRDFRGRIDLIYIDPPFDVGADFSMRIPVGGHQEMLEKDQSVLEAVAYRDTWGKGSDSYIHMMYERLHLMKELLSEEGSLAIHCDWRVVQFLRLILEEVFGSGLLINELIWVHQIMGGAHGSRLPKAHETLLWTAKTPAFRIHKEASQIRVPFSDYVLKSMQQDKDGRFFYTRRRMSRKATESELANKAHTITYVDDPSKGTLASDVWTDMPSYQPKPEVNTKYPTQKPDGLIERLIGGGTVEGGLVADFFCGSGTTGAVAEKLGRRWIMADLGRFAIHTSRKRMIEVQRQLYEEEKPYRAFDVYNLGRYERQWWQKERLSGADEEHRKIVLAFYRAEALMGASSPLLHGRKGAAFVFVDGIDSILTLEELKSVVEAAQAAGGKEIHCLAWEFEMEIKRNAQALEQEHGVSIRLVRIPREVMEKNRRPGVDTVPFFEMATLSAEPIINIEGGERIADVKLTHFLPSLSEVSHKELEALKERALTSGFDFIDFWAIDFDHQDGQPFKHHWQDYRLRKDRSLKTESDCRHVYPDTKAHTICVKVIDTFGCDTSILLKVHGAGGER